MASVAAPAMEEKEEIDMEYSGVSGGIARDRSTTAQRSRQGSKTATGRKRSPRERADLGGENGVVAWVDTASSPSAIQVQQTSSKVDWPGCSGCGTSSPRFELTVHVSSESFASIDFALWVDVEEPPS